MNTIAEKRPPYFKVYEEEARIFEAIPEELAGKLIKAACKFHLYGEVTDFSDPLEQATFDNFKEKLARGQSEYALACEQNARNARKRWEEWKEGNT